MVDAEYVDDRLVVVDAVENSIWAASRAVNADELARKWFADPLRVVCHLAEGELDDGGNDAGTNPIAVAAGGSGETDFVGHAIVSPTAFRDAELGAELALTYCAAGGHIAFGLGN